MKKTTKKRAKQRALKALSDYIRERDNWTCFTCNKQTRDKMKMDAGHLFSRRYLSILFHELNVHAQCVYCNRWLHGNLHEYIKKFKLKYGEAEYNKLDILKNTLLKMSVNDYLNMEEHLKQKLKELNNE